MPTVRDPKKLLKAWKSAKPLKLKETGVSEAIREIDVNDPATMRAFLAFADDKLKDKKLKAEKKAFACLQSTQTTVTDWLEDYESLTAGMASALEAIEATMTEWFADVKTWDGSSKDFAPLVAQESREAKHYGTNRFRLLDVKAHVKDLNAVNELIEELIENARVIGNIIKEEPAGVRKHMIDKGEDPLASVKETCATSEKRLSEFDTYVKAFR